jgi:prevent-host-death family protein
MTTLDTATARKDFASVVKAAKSGERVLLQRHGKNVAAVVSVRDLAYLRKLEDDFDNAAADVAMEDAKLNGTIPWEQLKQELGL